MLLIDCDLRLPVVATRLKLRNQSIKGLTDYLVGDAQLKDILLWDSRHGIYVICAGTIPPDPTRLLQSTEMAKLLNALKQAFPYIIIDCPPVGAVIDAALLSGIVSGYLLVVKHNNTDHKQIEAMLEQLQLAKANVLGFVYTNAPLEHNKYYKRFGKSYGGEYG